MRGNLVVSFPEDEYREMTWWQRRRTRWATARSLLAHEKGGLEPRLGTYPPADGVRRQVVLEVVERRTKVPLVRLWCRPETLRRWLEFALRSLDEYERQWREWEEKR